MTIHARPTSAGTEGSRRARSSGEHRDARGGEHALRRLHPLRRARGDERAWRGERAGKSRGKAGQRRRGGRARRRSRCDCGTSRGWLRRGADAVGEAGRRYAARNRAPSPRRRVGLRRHEHHAALGLGVGRTRGRHGPESRYAVLLAVGADRPADRGLCRAAVLRLGAFRPEGAAAQHGRADLACHHSRHGDEPLPDRARQRSGLFRRRGVAAVLSPDRPLSR